MKTAEDVAEEIVYPLYLEAKPDICRDVAKRIAQAITAYAEERVRIALDQAFIEWEKRTEERVKEEVVKLFEGEDCKVANLEREAYCKGSDDCHKNMIAMVNEARAEALEEAATVISDAGWNTADDMINAKFHTGRLVELIRALKESK